MKYTIVIKSGKPYEVKFNSDVELFSNLKEIYEADKENIDVMVLDEEGEDISDSQFINEIIESIID